ncbi:MAG: hypothetical protein H0W88_00175 [Parachlamydiaceae bacterium]|nr:hypothetical protein [Parachlamydiaceae bacterium]
MSKINHSNHSINSIPFPEHHRAKKDPNISELEKKFKEALESEETRKLEESLKEGNLTNRTDDQNLARYISEKTRLRFFKNLGNRA